MNLKLLYSVPSKRFVPHRSLSKDGRGGWTFSQVNVDRVVSALEDYFLIFGLGVMIEDAEDNDHVRATRLTARMEGEVIGTSELTWYSPNAMWNKIGQDSIIEWIQDLEMQPAKEGLIETSLEVQLHSQQEWLPVQGQIYCRLTLAKSEETAGLDQRYSGRLKFWWQSLFQKAFWPASKPVH